MLSELYIYIQDRQFPNGGQDWYLSMYSYNALLAQQAKHMTKLTPSHRVSSHVPATVGTCTSHKYIRTLPTYGYFVQHYCPFVHTYNTHITNILCIPYL